MTNAALIDIQAENIEARAAQRRAACDEAVALCGATSRAAFLAAYDYYQHAEREIERRGFCLACGGPLVGEVICARPTCGRDNS
jgi:hypothetical protein